MDDNSYVAQHQDAVFLTGEVTGQMYNEFIPAIHAAVAAAGNRAITVYINSGGGSIIEAFAIISLLQLVCPRGFNTHAIGWVGSAATLISMSGNVRYSAPTTEFVLHELWIDTSGRHGEAKARRKFHDDVMARLVEHYGHHSRMSRNQILKALTSEYWLNANEALHLGLIDEIAPAYKVTKP